MLNSKETASKYKSLVVKFFDLGNDSDFKQFLENPVEDKAQISKNYYVRVRTLISGIKVHEGKRYIVISPHSEGRLKIVTSSN
jgi:hypothetical protein